jgi:phage tail P2-like protein
MSDLLPPNANLHEHALDDATARIGGVAVDIDKLWDVPTIQAALLPWLAWAFSVDEWDETWTETQKRAMVSASYQMHSHKGTPISIKAALQALGYDNVQIREGETYFYNDTKVYDGSFLHGADGYWPLFDVILNIGYTPAAPMILKIQDRIERYKNARSQLRNLIFMNLLYNDTAIYDGTYNHNGGII